MINNIKRNWLSVLVVILVVMVVGCTGEDNTSQQGNTKSSVQSDYLMGTKVRMKAYHSAPGQVLKDSFSIVEDLEAKMSSSITDSEVNQVNQAAGQKKVQVSADTYQVIKKSLEYAQLTAGSFDPTIGPLVDLWGIGTENAQVPTDKQIKDRLSGVDYKQVELFPANKQVFLKQPDMKLDVGGIAKGYAADQVIDLWQKQGVESGFISLGGNVSVLGAKPDGSPWKVGIQDPKEPRGNVMATVEVRDKTVVTSGNYERYFVEDGVRYHHILNPQTGRPAKKGIISSTIITDNSFDADTLATAVYVLGVKEALKLIRDLPEIEALLINQDKEVYLTSGLEDKVSINQDKKYEIVD
ncbi:FAD:protein FMN transferase [Halanaerobaculum tunisiense]